MIHIGKKVPAKLFKEGWRETGAIHLGYGVWIISLEKRDKPKPKNTGISKMGG